MARRRHPMIDDSDEQSADEDGSDLFDIAEDDCGSDTDATSIEDLDIGDAEVDDEADVEDQIALFGGNVHPPEYYRQAVEEFNESAFDCEDYSPGTTSLLDAVEEQWCLFCNDILQRDPQQCYKALSTRQLYNFFDWCLNQKVGKNGRRKRGIKKKSSLGTYWKVFRLVFERATEEKIHPKLNRSMHKVLKALAKKHELSSQRRANRCMTIDGLKEQIHTTLSTPRKSFKLGELRILAVLFLLLLAPSGSRPSALLRLRFGDIRVVLARDPEGGPHRILIWFTLEFTKTFLGQKDAHSFPIPETLFDPCLLLSPHVFLLGVLFRHRAFLAPSLTSSQKLDNLDIHPGELELPLPLKKELNETYVFRRAVEDLTSLQLSPNEPISYAMMAAWIRRIGEILGVEYPTIPYSLRYNAANEFDGSADVSDALRNLALDHANSDPLQKHYLGRNIDRDLWAILRGHRPQHALTKQASSIGHSISKRRPIDLTTEQTASINTHPRIRQLTRGLQGLPRRSQQYRVAQSNIRKEKQRRRRNLKQKIRDEWTAKQAVDDIERQLRGDGFAEDAAADTRCSPKRPSQRLLVEALTAPVDTTLDGQYRRRDHAIDAVAAYCSVEEGCAVRLTETTAGTKRPITTHDRPADSPLRIATRSVFVKDEKERPRICFICVGKALSLPPDDPEIENLIHEFYTSGDLTKHFKRKHLANIKEGDHLECKVCQMPLQHKMHVQSHAHRVHGTVS